jgi:hypothetical protein
MYNLIVVKNIYRASKAKELEIAVNFLQLAVNEYIPVI